MIDVWAPDGTFADAQDVGRELAATLLALAAVPTLAVVRQNTATFVHLMPRTAIADVDGRGDYVRVQVLTSPGTFNRAQQRAVIEAFTAIVVTAARRPALVDRVWVVLTEAAEGGWGIGGRAYTGHELLRRKP